MKCNLKRQCPHFGAMFGICQPNALLMPNRDTLAFTPKGSALLPSKEGARAPLGSAMPPKLAIF